MEKEISIIKDKINQFIDCEKSKINFAKKFGKRNESVFVIGKTRYMESVVIYEDSDYIVLGENIENKKEIKDIIKKELKKIKRIKNKNINQAL
ncbi:MAG: hypothetical protein ACQERZ_05790 [Fusobacteriota bacterium]